MNSFNFSTDLTTPVDRSPSPVSSIEDDRSDYSYYDPIEATRDFQPSSSNPSATLIDSAETLANPPVERHNIFKDSSTNSQKKPIFEPLLYQHQSYPNISSVFEKTSHQHVNYKDVSDDVASQVLNLSGHDDAPNKQLRRWPRRARPLRRDLWDIGIDVCRFVISLSFIAFGFTAFNLSEKKVDRDSILIHVKDASLLLPTVFPIAFTALMAKTLRDIAIGLSVKGSRILVLEQLLQYSSVGASIVTFLNLGVFNSLGIGLLLLWSFSPLGGQGGLRMLETYNATTSFADGVAYYVLPNASTLFTGGSKWSDLPLGKYGFQIDNLFTPALVASVGTRYRKSPERDHLGRTKIPLLSSLNTTLEDRNAWIKVSSVLEHHPRLQYSSALGVTVKTTSLNKRSRFRIEASYLEADCHGKRLIERRNVSDSYESSLLTQRINENLNRYGVSYETRELRDERNSPPLWLFNITRLPFESFRNSSLADLANNRDSRSAPTELSMRISRMDQEPLNQNSSHALSDYITEFRCSVKEPSVEVEFSCIPEDSSNLLVSTEKAVESDLDLNGICQVEAMRQSQTYTRPYKTEGTYATVLDTNRDGSYGDIFLQHVAYAGKLASLNSDLVEVPNMYPILPEYYLYSPSNILGWNTDPEVRGNVRGEFIRRWEMDMMNVTLKDFQRRLTVLLNTFHHSVQSPYIRAHGIPKQGTEYAKWEDEEKLILAAESLDKGQVNFKLAVETQKKNLGKVTNTVIEIEERYRVRKGFLLMYMAASYVLFFSIFLSMVGLYLLTDGSKVSPPDILGYFSSFTRDNPYMEIEEETGFAGSALDGPQRTALLRNVKVRLGDVRASDSAEAGHIAFFREDIYGEKVPMLGSDPHRVYR